MMRSILLVAAFGFGSGSAQAEPAAQRNTAEASATGAGRACSGEEKAAVPESSRAIRERRIMMLAPP